MSTKVTALIDAVLAGKKDEAKQAFTSIMSDKSATALDVKRIQVTSKIYGK
jgi:hypothetical protein